jgi:protein-S-isoprenylcysteine O-methyltransferase Ste14
MTPFASIVDTQALLETVAAALVAGVGITLIFSITILGAARFVDSNREGRPVAAAAFGALAVIGLLAFLGAIAVGIIVMTTK